MWVSIFFLTSHSIRAKTPWVRGFLWVFTQRVPVDVYGSLLHGSGGFYGYKMGNRDSESYKAKQVIYDSSYTNGLEDKPPIYRP